MKKTRKILSIAITIALFISLLPMGSVKVSAVEFEAVIGDFNYRFNSDTYTAQVKQYYGTATEVTVPSTVVDEGYTYTVTEMKETFYDNETVTKVTISDGIETIGQSAFINCKGLASVTIPSSVTTIGKSAFQYCTGLASVTISGSVEEIGQSAFHGCTGLASITIPSSVKTIGHSAFADCTGLASVTISGSVEEIGQSAFHGCTGLASITILSGVKTIGHSAFADCTGLTSITIPDSVTLIGQSAFHSCTGLASITIPDSVTSIGERAFQKCTGLKSVTISDGVENIGQDAFRDCTGLTSVTIPDSVTTIGQSAFRNCSSLEEITVYYYITMPTIGDYAFSPTPAEANDNIKYIDTHTHTFDQENTDTKYWVSNATCEKGMLFSKSCICGAAGEETFEYGTPNRHMDEDGDGVCDGGCEASGTDGSDNLFDFGFDINLLFEFLKKLFDFFSGLLK